MARTAVNPVQSEGGFITYQEGNQLLGSGLMGAKIEGFDGAEIGSVSDLLLDREGQVQAVIVDVGAFLGIGTKDVAIANDELEFVLAPEAAAEAASTTGTPASPAADHTTTPLRQLNLHRRPQAPLIPQLLERRQTA